MPKIRRTDAAITGGRRGNKPKQPKSPKDYREAAREKWWQFAYDVMNGRPVKTAGSTGKAVNKILSEQHQVKIWETAGRKLFGDLSAQAVKAEIETTTIAPDIDGGLLRNLSRHALHDATERAAQGDAEAATFLEVVKAKREAMEQEARRQQPPPAPRGQLLLGRDDVIEVAGQPAGASVEPAAPSIELPAVGGVAEGVGHSPTSPTASLVSSSSQEPSGDTDASGVALSHGASIRNEIRADNRIDPPVHRPKVHRRRPR